MADTDFSIDVMAQATGADASAAEVNKLADAIEKTTRWHH